MLSIARATGLEGKQSDSCRTQRMYRYTVYVLKVLSSRPKVVQSSRPDARAAHFVARAVGGRSCTMASALFLLYDNIRYIAVKAAVCNTNINSVNRKQITERQETNEYIIARIMRPGRVRSYVLLIALPHIFPPK